jgi:hypothetical protein
MKILEEETEVADNLKVQIMRVKGKKNEFEEVLT